MLEPANEKRKTRATSVIRPYDLRRHAARAFRDAGVPESVCIEMMGQKSDSMFRRYTNLGDVADSANGFLAVARKAGTVVDFARNAEAEDGRSTDNRGGK
ncbi:MAG: hypothetical protein WEB59_08945 [Thermoanaerobaculia bacterium]